MGRAPASNRVSEGRLNKGPWTEEEDAILTAFIKANGEGNWRTLPKLAGNFVKIDIFACAKSSHIRMLQWSWCDLHTFECGVAVVSNGS